MNNIFKNPDLFFELSLVPPNCRYVLGIDEVGRGPWAGPVTVGAFLLDLKNVNMGFFKKYIRDSKSLTAQKRQIAFNEIEKNNYSFKTISVESKKIDKIGIQSAIIQSIYKLIKKFQGHFDFVLVDGNLKLKNASFYRSVVKADSSCFSVAAASICAKVTRDQTMINLSSLYPGYGFDKNKGYGTKSHMEGLKKLGPCPIHRFSYKPILQLNNSLPNNTI